MSNSEIICDLENSPISIILIVEDNLADVALVREVLRESSTPHTLLVAKDADEAIQVLRHKGKYASAPRPDLVLLDINLPGQSGHDLLREVKMDKALKTVPVIMLTSSGADADIELAYQNGANCYLQKPPDLKGYLDVIGSLDSFWLRVSILPRRWKFK